MRPVQDDDGSIGAPGNPVSGGSGGTENPAVANKNLKEGINVTIRPTNLSSAHLYNLRNQSWAIPRLLWKGNDTTVEDPIATFYNRNSKKTFPSNADTVNYAVYANTGSDENKLVYRFNVDDLLSNPLGTSQAPSGYFIIDALQRGSSRLSNLAQLKAQYPTLTYQVNTLPQDYTPGGPSVVCEFAGRIFYAGFSGEIVNGDANSPRMSSYILFSQLVTDISSIGLCYQAADPTNKDDSDLVDTDGGFIRVEGAYEIIGLQNIGANLAIIATNGVWLLSGGSGYGFKATDYKVTKVTSSGCIAAGSIVTVDNTLFYWGSDGIYHLAPNQFGDYQVENITEKTIQKLYNSILASDLKNAEGEYDSYEKKIKWLYGNSLNSSSKPTELVFDLSLAAFYPNKFDPIGDTKFPIPFKGIKTEPFQDSGISDVTVMGMTVTVNSANVTTSSNQPSNATKEIRYLVITGLDSNNNLQYGFATYNDLSHYDWRSIDGIGTDAYAYMITGYLSGGDFQRNKGVTYLTTHFNKTESGFFDDGTDWQLVDASSCLIQAQWDWSNSPNSGKWGREFEAYRLKRMWFPSNVNDSYDNGHAVVETKNKIRGNGKVVSFKFSSSPGKHMELLGWSLMIGVNQNV